MGLRPGALNADSTGIGFDTADGYAAFAAYRQPATSGGLVKSASADWFDAAPLTNGETAMQWTGLWTLPDVQDKLGDDFGVLPFPAARTAARRALRLLRLDRGGQGQGPGRAKAFVKWLSVDSEADQVLMGSAVAILPVLVVFLVLQRRLVQGVERSGIDWIGWRRDSLS